MFAKRALWNEVTSPRIHTDVQMAGGLQIVIPLMKSIFRDKATSFSDINANNPTATLICANLQMWLYVLSVVRTKAMYLGHIGPHCPVSVYLETLWNKNDDSVEEYRLFIMNSKPELYDLHLIYEQACKSKKKEVNKSGQFIDTVKGEGDVIVAHAPQKADQIAQSGTGSMPSENAVAFARLYELFMQIDNIEKGRNIMRLLSGIPLDADMLPRENRPIHITDMLTLSQAMRRGSRNVIPMQHDHQEYTLNNPPNIIHTIKHVVHVYKIGWDCWDPYLFMCKLFPHVQFNKDSAAVERRIRIMARALDDDKKKYARKKRRQTERLRNRILPRVETESVGNMRMRSDVEGGEPLRPVGEGEDGGDGGDAESSHNSASTSGGGGADEEDETEEERMIAMRAMGETEMVLPSDAIIAHHMSSCGLDIKRALETKPVITIDDVLRANYSHLIALRDSLRSALKIADGRHNHDAQVLRDRLDANEINQEQFRREETHLRYELNRVRNTLYIDYCNQYARFCTSSSSHVSDTMDILYRSAEEYKLFDRLRTGKTDVIITDPRLSPWDNYRAALTHGFQMYENVTFHGPTACKYLFITGNMFDRTPGLHANVRMTGDAGAGKSNLQNVVEKQIGKICKKVSSKSRRADSHNMVDVDSFVYTDDSNQVEKAASMENADGEERSLQTDNILTHVTCSFTPDGVRIQESHTLVRIGITAQSTNVDAIKINFAVPEVKKDAFIASNSRMLNMNFNNYKDELKSVLGAKANSKNKTPDYVAAIDDFRLNNQLMHILIAQYWQLEYIGCVPSPDMYAFTQLFPLLAKYIEDIGITNVSGVNRQSEKIELYCKQIVVRRSIMELFMLPTGVYFHTEYHPSQMLRIVPVCYETDVYEAFTSFADEFYPVELDIVLPKLRTMILNAQERKEIDIVYENPYLTTDDVEAAAAAAAARAAAPANRGGNGGASAVEGNAGVEDEYDRIIEDQSKNKRRRENTSAAAAADAPMAAAPKKISYVCFKGRNMSKLSVDIHYLAQTDKHCPSSSAVDACMYALSRWLIPTATWTKSTRAGDALSEDTSVAKVNRPGIVAKDGNVYVNYELIRVDGKFVNICEKAIAYSCSKHTLKRTFLSGLNHPEYPWLYKPIKIGPNTKERIAINNAYISSAEQILLTGVDDQSLIRADQQRQFISTNTDLDMICLLRFFSNSPATQRMSYDDVMRIAPNSIAMINKQLIINGIWNKTERRNRQFFKYPDHMIAQYNSARAVWEKIGSAVELTPQERIDHTCKQEEMLTAEEFRGEDNVGKRLRFNDQVEKHCFDVDEPEDLKALSAAVAADQPRIVNEKEAIVNEFVNSYCQGVDVLFRTNTGTLDMNLLRMELDGIAPNANGGAGGDDNLDDLANMLDLEDADDAEEQAPAPRAEHIDDFDQAQDVYLQVLYNN
jgi:hypothetical protein